MSKVGKLGPLQYIEEQSNGVTPTGQLQYGCYLINESAEGTDPNLEFVNAGGSQDPREVIRQDRKYGLRFQGRVKRAAAPYDPVNFPLKYILGAATGFADTLPTLSIWIPFESSEFQLFSGVKLSQVELSADGPGRAIQHNVTAVARHLAPVTSKTVTGYQSVTVGADAAVPSSPTLCMSNRVKCDYGSGRVDFTPRSWKLNINRNLDPQPKTVVGADSQEYHLAAGDAILEGVREVRFTATWRARDEAWIKRKIAAADIEEIVIPYGAKNLVLKDCVVLPDSHRETTNELHDETIVARCTGGVTVESA